MQVDAYIQEDFKNEELRNIQLLNSIYIRQAKEALQAALTQGEIWQQM